MHVKFAAVFPHPNNKYTHFLSLDKCLQKRPCLQILHFEPQGADVSTPENSPVRIWMDATWLWVLRATAAMQK